MTSSSRLALRTVLAVVWTASVSAGVARGGDAVDVRRFPKLAHLLLLPDEQALLGQLKDDKDRRAFQAIFWARRDPSPGTPANEFEDNVRAAWKHADDLFSYPNEKGSETGCGQVIALLGPPEEIQGATDARTGAPTQARGASRTFDNMAYLSEGPNRGAETWIYRDRPRLPYHFTGAELRVAFDPECRFAEGGIVAEDMRRAAETLVTRPELAYARAADGHLLAPPAGGTAAASTAATAGVRALLSEPRTDFPLAAEPKLVMRTSKGETYVAGLVQATLENAAAAPTLAVAVMAKDASGQTAATTSSDVKGGPPGAPYVGAWGLTLKPGRYTVTIAAQLADRGSVARLELEVPDFSGKALAASPLLAYPDEPQAAATGAGDPYAALRLGTLRLRPRLGNVFAPSDSLMVVAALYGAKLDAASGKASLKARYSILKDGRPVARGAEDVYPTADAVASVGPIPLGAYTPGSYVVRLEVTDAVAGQSLVRETSFEVRKP